MRFSGPHGRREHISKSDAPPPTSGSSPRAWGTRRARLAWYCQTRFIPTGVGNTLVQIRSATAITVHPHGRGEHSSLISSPAIGPGSSPRAWGTRRPDRNRRSVLRFIPTGVGNICCQAGSTHAHPVHPHGRGEHCKQVALDHPKNRS